MSGFFPIRCFTCAKVIAHKYKKYKKESSTQDPLIVLDTLCIIKGCCRRMFLSHTDIEDDLLLYDTPGMENFAKSDWQIE